MIMYGVRNVYNADQFALCPSQAPRRTISPGPLRARKKSKTRYRFLVCASADGKNRLQPLVVGADNARCLNGRAAHKFGFHYTFNHAAWVNFVIFLLWTYYLDYTIRNTTKQPSLLHLDNASCHGKIVDIPKFQYLRLFFLPKKATSILQPLYAGVIAYVKRRYRQNLTTRDVELIDGGTVENLYNVDLKTAIQWVYNIWFRQESDVIRNCWAKTTLV